MSKRKYVFPLVFLVCFLGVVSAQGVDITTRNANGNLVYQGTSDERIFPDTRTLFPTEPALQARRQTAPFPPVELPTNQSSVNLAPSPWASSAPAHHDTGSLLQKFPGLYPAESPLRELRREDLPAPLGTMGLPRGSSNRALPYDSQDPYVINQMQSMAFLSANPFFQEREVRSAPSSSPPPSSLSPNQRRAVSVDSQTAFSAEERQSVMEFEFRLRRTLGHYPTYVFQTLQLPKKRSDLLELAPVDILPTDQTVYRVPVNPGKEVFYTFIDSFTLNSSEDFYLNTQNSQQFNVKAGIQSNFNGEFLPQEQEAVAGQLEAINEKIEALQIENALLKEELEQGNRPSSQKSPPPSAANPPQEGSVEALLHYIENAIPFITILPEEQKAIYRGEETAFTVLLSHFIQNRRSDNTIIDALDYLAVAEPYYFHRSLFYRGQMHALKGQLDRALQDFLRVQDHFPHEASVWIQYVTSILQSQPRP